MAMTPTDVIALVADDLLVRWENERRKLDRIDRWARWEHDRPHQPRQATAEYNELSARSQAPWGDLIVTSVAQTLYVEGYRSPSDPDNSSAWRLWQVNGMDGRQVAIHRAALTYGLAYGFALPGRTMTGEAVPVIRGASPRQMIAVYDDPANDDWPVYALRVSRRRRGRVIELLDDTQLYELHSDDYGAKPVFIGSRTHGAGVCPVVRFANRFDLEGRSAGEIEPFIPVLGRIDQTAFDRLVVQRFASWIVRTVAGMALPESAAAAGVTPEEKKLQLRVEDILIAKDPATKFGSLPATPLDGFIKAHESDIHVLAAVSQTPAHEMLGQMANLSAEALAAARASLTSKSDERKVTFGEAHEQLLRLGAHLAGDQAAAADFESQVRWKDTEIRSLAQAADALGKMAQMLGVPVELLWEKVPGFTDQDVERAKALLAQQPGGLDSLLRELAGGQTSPTPADDTADLKKRADAMGVLIRSGVEPVDAAQQAGLTGVRFTDLVPVTLRPPGG
jgi:hypothetical protein